MQKKKMVKYLSSLILLTYCPKSHPLLSLSVGKFDFYCITGCVPQETGSESLRFICGGFLWGALRRHTCESGIEWSWKMMNCNAVTTDSATDPEAGVCCMCAKSLHLCPTLCNTVDYSLPVSSVQGILQVGILEWVVIPSSRGSSPPRYQTSISWGSCLDRQILYHWATRKAPNGVSLWF